MKPKFGKLVRNLILFLNQVFQEFLQHGCCNKLQVCIYVSPGSLFRDKFKVIVLASHASKS